MPISGKPTYLAIRSSFSALPPPAIPMLPITLPLYHKGAPPLSSRSSGNVFRFLESLFNAALLINSSVEVLVDKAV